MFEVLLNRMPTSLACLTAAFLCSIVGRDTDAARLTELAAHPSDRHRSDLEQELPYVFRCTPKEIHNALCDYLCQASMVDWQPAGLVQRGRHTFYLTGRLSASDPYSDFLRGAPIQLICPHEVARPVQFIYEAKYPNGLPIHPTSKMISILSDVQNGNDSRLFATAEETSRLLDAFYPRPHLSPITAPTSPAHIIHLVGSPPSPTAIARRAKGPNSVPPPFTTAAPPTQGDSGEQKSGSSDMSGSLLLPLPCGQATAEVYHTGLDGCRAPSPDELPFPDFFMELGLSPPSRSRSPSRSPSCPPAKRAAERSPSPVRRSPGASSRSSSGTSSISSGELLDALS